MDNVYTSDQIKEAWDSYQSMKVLKVLKDGKWKVYKNISVSRIDATKAEVVKINTVMSFPKFLEKEYR